MSKPAHEKKFNLVSNIKLTVAYDGTGFFGWQSTKMGPSIESTLQDVLKQILQHPITLQAASRTDAGVHAQGQVVNFFTHRNDLSLPKLKIGLNSLLPKSIAVMHVEEAAENFHPTLDSAGKEYHYYICIGPAQLPQHRLYSWHYPYTLDIEAMKRAAKHMEGRHDFSAFCNFKKNSNYDHYIREVHSINIVEMDGQRLRFEIAGNNFLYKMVRNMVGTLAYVGQKKIDEASIPTILERGDRTLAGITAPSHGLFLYRVNYLGLF